MVTVEFGDVLALAGAVALVPCLYAVLRIAGLAITDQYRRKLARAGEAFLARDDITEDQRNIAKMWLSTAFKGRWPWALVFLFPLLIMLILVLTLLRLLGAYKLPRNAARQSDADTALAELGRLSIFASLGAAPIAATLLIVEFVFLSPVALATRTYTVIKKAILEGPRTLEKLSF